MTLSDTDLAVPADATPSTSAQTAGSMLVVLGIVHRTRSARVSQ
jgi:hypothetical protein